MSAALSLLEEDPFGEPRLTVVPDLAPPTSVASVETAPSPSPATPARTAWQPITVLPGLVLATVFASPALVQGLVRHQITLSTMLGRWGLVALGCCLIGEGVRRYFLRAEAAGAAATAEEPVAPSAAADPLDPLEGFPDGL